MKPIQISLVFLVLSLIIYSCDEGIDPLLPYTSIEGQVLEYGTNKPIENAQVILYKRVSTGTFSGANMAVDTFLTDATGQYSFIYEGDGNLGLNAFHDTYFNRGNDIYGDHIYSKIENKNIDIILDPYALLELHIKNVNPFDENDNIRYDGDWSGGAPQDNLGTNVDFHDIKEVRGNRNINIIWWVTKNGEKIEHQQNIYCKSHETTQYEILY